MRCKVCKTKFQVKYFLQKTCSTECKHEYEKQEPKRRIKKVSDKRKTQEKVYKLLRQQYLNAIPKCERCKQTATEIHHKNGREGKRLNDQTYFMAVCRTCHNYIHENPLEARKKSWLI
jgi:hypothetical protein